MNLQLWVRRHGRSPGVGRVAGRLLQGAALAAAVALFASYAQSPSVLTRVQRAGELVVATPNSPTTYYHGARGATGPVYDLARRFAAELGVRLKILEVANGHQALAAVAAGRADIAAPGFTAATRSSAELRFTPPYQRVSNLLIYRAGEAVPKDATDLAGSIFKLTVAPGFVPLLDSLAKAHPGIHWQTAAGSGGDDLLIAVAQGKAAYTIVNENEFNIDRRIYPDLRAAFPLGPPRPLAWAVRRADPSLYQAAVAFFARAKADRFVADLVQRYYHDKTPYNRVATRLFLDDVGARLADYTASFEQAAQASGFSWQLLAAVGYQESHWNPHAVSPTGVRGLMMLTLSTAQTLGIHDRTNPKLSILGAARYLARLRARLPASIQPPNRQWMVLAAYNVGLGHLMDARRLTKRQGGNPNLWADVKQRLAQLNESRYYSHTRYGYANGIAAVHYVTNIRNYENILAWRLAQNTLPAQVTDLLKSDTVVATPAE